MKTFLLFLALSLNTNIIAQVFVNTDAIQFPHVFTTAYDTSSFYVINKSSTGILLNLRNIKNVFTLSDTVLTIPPNDSLIVWVRYHPVQNVIDKDIIFISANDSAVGLAINVIGNAYYGDSYDAATFNKYDTELKNALNSLVNNHTSLGYNLARDKMFMEIDNQKVNGQGAPQNTLECVYTGRKAVGYVDRTDAQNNYNFNTEHTWPQSNFSEQEPMKSDLFHLFPTDNPANGIRSNYPFGKVVSNVTWDSAGSKLGKNYLNQIVFEPRDVHKGNVSRSMFYFITRYPVNYGSFFTQVQEDVFREWNKLDSVDTAELNRNTVIAVYQGKRNPYIDHPEFADRIYSFFTNTVHPVFTELNLLPYKINFDSVSINDTTSHSMYIINSGNKSLTIDSITVSDKHFILVNYLPQVEAYSAVKTLISFKPDSAQSYEAVVKVYSGSGFKQIELSGEGKNSTVNTVDESTLPGRFSLSQNYPNPFNPVTIIRFSTAERQFISLRVYDVLGSEIATLISDVKNAGNYEISFDAVNIPSGVYFYKLQAGNFVETKKMMLLK